MLTRSFLSPKLGLDPRQIKKSKARLTGPAEYQHSCRFGWPAAAFSDASRSGRQKRGGGGDSDKGKFSTHILSSLLRWVGF